MTGEVQIRSSADGSVLDVRHTIRAGATIQMFKCNVPPTRNQVWVLDDAGFLRCGGPSAELVLQADGGRHGAAVSLAERADGEPEQRWELTPDGRLASSADGSLVLEAREPHGREGRVRLGRRREAAGQVWELVPVPDPAAIIDPEPYDEELHGTGAPASADGTAPL